MPIESKLIEKTIKAAFPDCNKRATDIVPSEKVSITGNYWSGGHCRYYSLVELATNRAMDLGQINPMRGVDERTVELKPGFVIVCRTYSGQRQYITVFCHPSNTPANLTVSEELTADERTVLFFTRSYKNSYAGQSNLRYSYAKAFTKISELAWQNAQTSLKSKGMLNAAHSLTISGKNAANKLRECYEAKTIITSTT